MASVRLTDEARSHLSQLPTALRDAVNETLTEIQIDPESPGKQLLGRLRGLWSARVGSYRILYSVEGPQRAQRVIIPAIRHRAVAYRRRRRR